ncbi:hypothetical protein FGO68_gene1663 [Halteria grandinella]|uniref:Uncharacterized protein n=1 Tax=Halteria grandinella TaxID=5974 RepID=A0A8J8T9W2_HALGN|nr:hypothetical protein FGO68_gene1663 [Halteria grandinella]
MAYRHHLFGLSRSLLTLCCRRHPNQLAYSALRLQVAALIRFLGFPFFSISFFSSSHHLIFKVLQSDVAQLLSQFLQPQSRAFSSFSF